jgi:hypothetical protein
MPQNMVLTPRTVKEIHMRGKNTMPFQKQAAVISSRLPSRRPREIAPGIAGGGHPALARDRQKLREEISGFIFRQVFEREARFFDG